MKLKNYRVSLYLLLIHFSLLFTQSKVLVNIDRIVREIDENTVCALDKWANSLDASCKCCLVTKARLLDTGKKATDILQECINKGNCTHLSFEHIEKELHESGKTEEELQRVLRKLYNNSLVIKEVNPQGITFDKNGNFTEEGLALFLEHAYKEGKLPHEAFKSAHCLKVKNLSEEKGYGTVQLFTIESTCEKKNEFFILKEIASKYSETHNLAQIYGIHSLDEFVWPHTKSGYPTLVIPLAFIKYNDHYLSLMPRASGVSLASFMKDYVKKPDEANKKRVIQAYSDVGSALGRFHRKFMKPSNNVVPPTVIHGDFHHQNIFYNENSHQVSFIDTERLPATVTNPQDPVRDLIYLLLVTLDANPLIPSEIRSTLNKQQWINLVAYPFLTAYITTYPTEDRLKVFEELQKRLKASPYYQKFPFDTALKEIQENLKRK